MRTLAGGILLLAVVACSAVLMLSAKSSDGRPSELFYADHMGDITAGAGLSSRLPEDQGLGQGLRMRDNGDGLSDGFAEAHWDSTRLPDDKQGSAQLVHGGLPGDMTDPLDGNKAAALRSQNFKRVLADCKAKGNCEQLLGKQLWNVLSSKSGEKIADDFDDDRKGREEKILHDLEAPANGKGSSESSSRRWEKLQALFGHGQQKLYAKSSGEIAGKIKAIAEAKIPDSAKIAQIKQLRQSGKVMRRASRDMDSYQDETSLIYGGYKRNMVESKRDVRDETQEDRSSFAKPTEAAQLRTEVKVADDDLAKKVSKGGISTGARRMVQDWTAKAATARAQTASDPRLAQVRASRLARQASGQASLDGALHASESSEISSELSRYDDVFQSSHDDTLRTEDTERQEALARSRAQEKAVGVERRRRAAIRHQAEARESVSAARELASYNSPFSSSPRASRGEAAARAARRCQILYEMCFKLKDSGQ
jgi:hypothetical protein